MIETLIRAEAECTEWTDAYPDKVLRPIGTIFKEWCEDICSTELAHWICWEVVGYMKSFSGRSGNEILYERMEEIKLKE